MSHIVKVEVQLKDLSALRAAVEELGCTLEMAEPGQHVHYKTYYGSKNRADGVIKVKDAHSSCYSVGLVKTADDKAYTMIFDEHQGGYGLTEKIGPGASRIKGAYSEKVTRKTLAAAGYNVNVVKKNGKVVITATKR